MSWLTSLVGGPTRNNEATFVVPYHREQVENLLVHDAAARFAKESATTTATSLLRVGPPTNDVNHDMHMQLHAKFEAAECRLWSVDHTPNKTHPTQRQQGCFTPTGLGTHLQRCLCRSYDTDR